MSDSTATCRLCGANSELAFSHRVLSKYNVRYYSCSHCEFMQTEHPFWLQEAYKNSMNLSDCGILLRNIYISRILAPLLYLQFDRAGCFVDYAGGYGVLTRLMRDIGFDFFTYDPHTTNLLAKGFDYAEGSKSVEMVTALETFEHFSDPLKEIEKILAISPNLFFSTQLLPRPIPARSWWYYGFEHGQHISFYSLKSLRLLATRLGLTLYSNRNNFHLLTTKIINPLLFRYLPLLSKYGLFFYVRSRMRSRTMEDMTRLVMLQEKERGVN